MNISPLSSVISASGYSRVETGKPSGADTLAEKPGQNHSLPEASGTEYVSSGDDLGNLGEIEVAVPAVNDMSIDEGHSARLASQNGGIPVKMAASLYVLNHSFDEQKSILQLIA